MAARFSSAAAPYSFDLAHWIRVRGFQEDFSFYLDQLSLVMILVVTGVKMLFKQEESHPERNAVVRWISRLIPTTSDYRGGKFAVRELVKRFFPLRQRDRVGITISITWSASRNTVCDVLKMDVFQPDASLGAGELVSTA